MRSLSVGYFFTLCLALTGCPSPATNADTGNGGTDTGTPTVDTGTPAVDTGTPPVDTGTPPVDTGTPAVDTGTPPVDTGTPATDAGCDGVLLTVVNALVWCDVSVNGGTASPAGSQTVCVPASTDVSLVHTAHTGFILGNWHHTDGDTAGAGEPGTVSGTMSTAHIMTGAAGTSSCAWVCCPFPGGTGCPTTDQCP